MSILITSYTSLKWSHCQRYTVVVLHYFCACIDNCALNTHKKQDNRQQIMIILCHMSCCQTIITAEITKNKTAQNRAQKKSWKQWKLLYLYLFYLHVYFKHHYCVLARNCTYQSHALLLKGGRPCNLQPVNNERIEGQISITVSSVSGSEMHILTRWEKLL